MTGVPIAPGKDMNWTIGVISNTTLSFDYVLYEDGTSWGPNKFERSNEIANVLAARAAVMARVTELAHGYSDPDDFAVMQRDFGGLSSYDAAGPPNPLKREQHILGAWNMAILKLRSNRRRPIEANELADKLEVERPRISIESKAKVEPLSHAKP